MTTTFKQGYFIPKNPDKYVGGVDKIRYLSSWEYELDKFFDGNPNVLQWSSEPVAIPYIKPTDKRVHKYYPDYWVKYRTADGTIVQEILECKPLAQTKQPRGTGKYKLYEQITYAINVAKWQACQSWCDVHGMKFRIITERSIFR